MNTHRHAPIVLLLVAPLSACVTAGRYHAKEGELAALVQDSSERDRKAAAERNRIERDLETTRAQQKDLGRKLAAVSYDRDVLREARDQDLALMIQLRKRLESLGQNVEALTHEKGALAATVSDAYGRLQDLNRQKQAAEQRAATYQELSQKLQAMIDTGALEVVIRQGRMLIIMPNDVLFDSGRTEIKAQGRETLAAVARALAGVRDRRFTVVGHTDDVPIHTARFRSNWDLSTARAVEVALYLVDHGIRPQILGAAGHGEFDPVTANDSDQHRARNRRVEVELEPNITELPPFTPASAVSAR